MSVRPCLLFAIVVLSSACQAPPPPPPLVAQVSGTLEIPGIAAPVRVVRDRWGVPHIFAESESDLFTAQGFVQAQDRLFQMDLWRRSALGRLSEVLGPNFIERDAMTRRIQYRGDINAEWAAYDPQAQAILGAFVQGINLWVTLARERPPEEFALAGWKPDFWSSEDLLNRTDAFLASGDAIADVRRAQMSDVVAEAIGRIGAAPFFAGLAADVAGQTRIDRRPGVRPAPDGPGVKPDSPYLLTFSPTRVSAAPGGMLSQSEAKRVLANPSPRYLVHLKAPGWNVIGATSPWLPGVAVGHNDRVAWGMAPLDVDTQDLHVDDLARTTLTTKDAIVVKGRREPFEYETQMTAHGVVVAVDRETQRAFTLRWSGTEPGGAAELGALVLDRAQSAAELRAALAQWRMPARRVVFTDIGGGTGIQDAGLVPRRRAGEWSGWIGLDDLPHAQNSHGPLTAAGSSRRDVAVPENAVFVHPLAITGTAERRFNIGPMPRPRADDSPVRTVFDPRDWDRSRALNAPGQSETPASPHFQDLAKLWMAGELFPLAFSDAAVAANAKNTLTLLPQSGNAPHP